MTESFNNDVELNFDITIKAKSTRSLDRELAQLMKVGQKIKSMLYQDNKAFSEEVIADDLESFMSIDSI
jgi:hypothetical protein